MVTVRYRAVALLLVSTAAPLPSWAQEAEVEPLLAIRLNGYADLRISTNAIDVAGLLPTRDAPWLSFLLEANNQLRFRWGGAGFLSTDVSIVYQRGAVFFGQDAQGRRRQVADHDVPALRPFLSLSELYGSYNLHEHFNVTLGKQRIVWGAGFAQNPTDLLNPPKDPTDPSFQRAGGWLVKLEAPFTRLTASLVAAAQVTRSASGVPTAFLYYPDAPPAESVAAPAGFPYAPDAAPHWALAARLYTLQWDADINAFYYFTNLYNDAFTDKSRVGVSLSKYVTEGLELHLEALGQLGSARTYVDADCVHDLQAVAACAVAGRPVATTRKLGDGRPRARALVGARYTFADDAMLSGEYYVAGDGYADGEYTRYLEALALLRGAQAGGVLPGNAAALFGAPTARDPGVPQKFTFEPLRQHYLFASYVKPRIADDFTLSLVLLLSLHDLSGQLAPSLAWSAAEWLTLSAYAFVTLPGVAALAPVVAGAHRPEFALSPVDWRVLLSAKVFY